MSLKHALLGFLNYQPMTGYELKKLFDVSISHFWNGELSHIYSSLKQLEADGLADVEVEVQRDRPNRKIYSITDDGRRELDEWLASPPDLEQVREPVLVKVFFGASCSRAELLAVLEKHIADTEKQLETTQACQAISRKVSEQFGLEKDAFFWDLTIDSGLRYYDHKLEWAREAMRSIEAQDESFFSAPPRTAALNGRVGTDLIEQFSEALPHTLASGNREES